MDTHTTTRDAAQQFEELSSKDLKEILYKDMEDVLSRNPLRWSIEDLHKWYIELAPYYNEEAREVIESVFKRVENQQKVTIRSLTSLISYCEGGISRAFADRKAAAAAAGKKSEGDVGAIESKEQNGGTNRTGEVKAESTGTEKIDVAHRNILGPQINGVDDA